MLIKCRELTKYIQIPANKVLITANKEMQIRGK